MKKIGWPGKGWKVTCHVCGMWFPSTEIRKRWDGVLVCDKDWETRHPQTLIKIKGESAVPTFISKDPTDTFIHYCSLEGQSAYADMATADCARADNITFTYAFLLDLNKNGHGGL